MPAEDDNPRQRRTNADLYDVLMEVRDEVRDLRSDREVATRTAADHETRIRVTETDLTTIKSEVSALRSTVASWSKGLWALVSGLIITVVGAVVAYGVLAGK